jgi:hypothetical protein
MKLLRTLVSEQENNYGEPRKSRDTRNGWIIIIGEKSNGYKIKDKWSFAWKLQVKDLKLSEKLMNSKETMKDNVNKHGEGYQIVHHWFRYLKSILRNRKIY